MPGKAIATNPRVVEQVDLAPTLSALLGHPTPFTSLGTIIPELFYLPFQSVVERYAKVISTTVADSTNGKEDKTCHSHSVDNAPDKGKTNRQKRSLWHSACDLCHAAYVSDPLAFQLHQNAMQVFSFIMSYFADSVPVNEMMNHRDKASVGRSEGATGVCAIPSNWGLPVICPSCAFHVNPPADAVPPKYDDCSDPVSLADGTTGTFAGTINSDINPVVWPLRVMLTQAICSHRAYMIALEKVAIAHDQSGMKQCEKFSASNECTNSTKGTIDNEDGTEMYMNVVRDEVYIKYLSFLREVLGFAR